MNKVKIHIGCLILSAVVLLTACSQEEQKVEEDIIRPVRYERIVPIETSRSRTFNGIAKSELESTLSFRVGGAISRLKVKVGDAVKKGQLLATLDSSDYQLQVQQVEAQLEQTRSQELSTKASYDRVRGLYESQNASKSDLDSARAAYESALASVRSTEKQLALQRSQKNYTQLAAPFNGAVSAVSMKVNENVTAGSPVLTLTGHQSELEVEVAMPGVLIADVQRGDVVLVEFAAVEGKLYEGLVSEVGIATSQQATTYPVTIALNQSDAQLRPGMSAEVTFSFASSTNAKFLVPSHAVIEDQRGKTYVFVVQPLDGGFGVTKRKDVSVGGLSSDGLEIMDGLEEEDLLITAGMSRIHEDMKVKLLGEEE